MADAPEHVIELIFGRWRSQILYAGAILGVFGHLADSHVTDASALAPQVGADPALLYRLLRALAAIGLLAEDGSRGFRLTEAGALLREDHPHSLMAMALLEEGPQHYAVWKHLVPILRDGRQDGFLREFGAPLFEYVRANPRYAAVFNRAMTSYSVVETQWALAALASEDFSKFARCAMSAATMAISPAGCLTPTRISGRRCWICPKSSAKPIGCGRLSVRLLIVWVVSRIG